MIKFLFLCFIVPLASTLSPDEVGQASAAAVDQGLHPADVAKKAVRDEQDFQRFPDKSTGPQRCYTWAEVAQRDGQDGRPLFIVVSDKVYDVTDFSDFHPGGPEPLQRHAGQDATAAMRATNMPQQVYDVFLQRFQVGWVEDKCDA